MKLYIQTDKINGLFVNAHAEKRNSLYEYEVYELIRLIGGETPLSYRFLGKDERITDEIFEEIPGDKVVVKIVSPNILHKSDIGGVKIIPKTRSDLLSTVREMMYDVPERYGKVLGATHNGAIDQLRETLKGVLICEYLPIEALAFGNELLVSIRRTREFGMILTAGLGGTDTELYAQRFRPGQAVVSASTKMVDADRFFDLFKKTLSFDKLTGIGRGEKRKVTNEQLKECFAALIKIGNHYSPLNPGAPFVIEELEINPFAFYKYLMVPLDGLCRFSKSGDSSISHSVDPSVKVIQSDKVPTLRPASKKSGEPDNMPTLQPVSKRVPQFNNPSTLRPISKIDQLLHPASMAIMGVSVSSRNPGQIILENIISGGFDPQKVFVIHPSIKEMNESKVRQIRERDFKKCQAVADLTLLPQKVDLLILAVRAEKVEAVLDVIIKKDIANSVILIPGGLGEVSGSESKQFAIEKKIAQSHRYSEAGGPIFLGGNCLGVLSHPGKYDTLFVPQDRLPKSKGTHPRRTAIISQSGAYMITRMSKMAFLDPAYALSIGNQMDITAGDLLRHFNTLDEITTIAVYMEGFRDLDGLAFAEAVRDAVKNGKEILFYKAGRTPEGKTATSGHTASLAGDYVVCRSCIREAGAMVAETFTEFEGLVKLSWALHEKIIRGNGLAAISNAGYESVGIADNILGEDFQLRMATFSHETKKSVSHTITTHQLSSLVDIKNPMDVTPMADETVYEEIIDALLKDTNTHAVVAAIIPMTPMIDCFPVKRLAERAARYDKPVIMVIDSGELYDDLARAFQAEGLPVFRSADQAVYILGKYIQGRLRAGTN